MLIWSRNRLLLLAAAFCFLCFTSTAAAQGRRLYGMIDIDAAFFGHDIAFSVDLDGSNEVRFYTWGRELDEVEGMALDQDGELYLFNENGVVSKVRTAQPDAPLVPVPTPAGYTFTSATVRPSDGIIELYDARGGQFVRFDPRSDRLLREPAPQPRVRLPMGPACTGPSNSANTCELSGLARTATRLYGSAMVEGNLELYTCTDRSCSRACTVRLNSASDVQAIERYTDTMLIIARIEITETNEILLHVESLDPRSCALTRVLKTPLDQERIRRFLRPSLKLDQVLRRVRQSSRSPQIEAIALQTQAGG
jgi:hypothetical protein